ncbi:MAG: ferrous iron transport protein A [Planctomycetales bacterium]|nr:ferrous iron transport protein A [Planctomycetales bacterium]
MINLIPLSFLKPGQRGCVQIMSGGDFSRRLSELGISSGSHVEMVRPGKTCILRVDNCKLCLRECETSCILVSAGEEN